MFPFLEGNLATEGLTSRSRRTLGPWSFLRPQPSSPPVIFSLDFDLPPGSPGHCTPKSSESAPATLAGVPRRTAKKAESLSNSSRSESIHNSPKSCPTPEVSAGAGPGVWFCLGEGGAAGRGALFWSPQELAVHWLLLRGVPSGARPRERGVCGFLWVDRGYRRGRPCSPGPACKPSLGAARPHPSGAQRGPGVLGWMEGDTLAPGST